MILTMFIIRRPMQRRLPPPKKLRLKQNQLPHPARNNWIMGEQDKSLRTSAKEWTDLIQNVLATLAIIAGAWWFFQQGLSKPRVNLEQTVTCRPLADSPDTWLVGVDIKVSNIGSVAVHLKEGELIIGQMNPLPGHDLQRTSLKELWLEPGESDQAAFLTVSVPNKVKTVFVESKYSVPGKSQFWSLRSATDLNEGGLVSSHELSPHSKK